MPLLQSIGIIDVFSITHSLYVHQKALGSPKQGVRYLPVTDDILAEWQILKSFLGRCQRILEERGLGEWQMTNAALRWLDPRATVPWSPGVEGEVECHIGIVTHPLSRLIAGPEIYSLGWGECVLSMAGPLLGRSDINASDLRTVSLILTLRQAQRDAEAAA
jgi:hypothetical protein